MSNPEKDEEILARKWLESQGYTDIKRPCSDPPDYVVNSEYAVEVRRLNQRIEIDGRFKGEEQSRIALRDTIEKVLEEFGPPNEGQVWIVDCEYDFSKPLPEKRITKREIGRCCMIQLRREWGRFSNFSFRTPQRRISAYPARPSG